MSEAPERIWVKTRGVPKYYEFPCEDLPLLVEYVRADRIEELEAKLAKAVEALVRIADKHSEMTWWGVDSEVREAMNEMQIIAETILTELIGGKDD